MDDQGDDWGDLLAGFDIADLSAAQREALSAELADAGILHAFVGPELQGPAAESELIEHLVGQARRSGGRRRRTPPPAPGFDPAPATSFRPTGLGRFLVPWGGAPIEAMILPLSARWKRFAAYLAEAIAFQLVAAVVLRYSVGGAQVFAIASSLTSAIVLVAAFGGSAGMLALRMRVVLIDHPDRQSPGWRVAVVRYVVAWWPEAVLFALIPFVAVEQVVWMRTISDIWLVICFAPILLDPARRGLHDRIVGTVVIDVDRPPALAGAGSVGSSDVDGDG